MKDINITFDVPPGLVEWLEYLECAKNPVHFINNHVSINNPTRGVIKLTLNKDQEALVGRFQKENWHSIGKDRQVGMTTLAVAYSLWMMLFKPNTKVIMLSPNFACGDSSMKIFYTMYDNLPSFVKETIITKCKRNAGFVNGSSFTVESVNSFERVLFSTTPTMVIVDEASFCQNVERLMGEIKYRQKNGKIIMYSSSGDNTWMNYTGEFEHHQLRFNIFSEPELDFNWSIEGKNRFIIYNDDIPSYVIKSIITSTNRNEIFSKVDLEVYNVYGPNVIKEIADKASHPGKLWNFRIVELSPIGDKVASWTIGDATLTNIDFSNISSEHTFKLTLQFPKGNLNKEVPVRKFKANWSIDLDKINNDYTNELVDAAAEHYAKIIQQQIDIDVIKILMKDMKYGEQ